MARSPTRTKADKKAGLTAKDKNRENMADSRIRQANKRSGAARARRAKGK